VPVLDGELRRDEAAHRLPDEANLRERELVEQLGIVQHVIVDIVDGGVVGRRPEARMVGNEHAELARPCCGEIEARHRACAM
jgi:hypothetical protein